MRKIIMILVLVLISPAALAYKGSSAQTTYHAEDIAVYETAPASCSSILPISATGRDRDNAFLKLLKKATHYGGDAITKFRERYDGTGYRMEATVLSCGEHY